MTDSISKLGQDAIDLAVQTEQAKQRKASEVVPAPVEKTTPAADEVILTEAVQAALRTSEFDADKVAQIKKALAEGNYPFNEKRIAESFVAIEKMIGGK